MIRILALTMLMTLRMVAAVPAAQQFASTVQPFLQKHCLGCHSGKTPAAQFDLSAYKTVASVTQEFPRWALIMERLRAKDMPPKPLPAPPAADADRVIHWIEQVRAAEIKRSAGDPGLVLARRLSNAEYNYTIRDLTGQNLEVTREFPIDPANTAGFDNSGESLTMSPALLNKYLQAARSISSNMVLAPEAIQFSPHPMLVETDREKYAIQRIVNFYFRQPTKYADYFAAAWRFQHRAALGAPRATLESIAAEKGLSPRYLPQVWTILNEPGAIGPVAKLQSIWKALPTPGQAEQLVAGCQAMDEFVTKLRAHTAMQFAAPKVRGLPPASQPLLNWKLKQFATHRRESDPAALRNDADPPPDVPAIPRYAGLHQEAAPRWAALMARDRAGDSDLVVPAADRARYQAAFARLASVFPDKFYITERGRYFPDDSEDKGRLLSAGYHSVLGFYRDDQPLMELILDDKSRQELDRLWNEFDYIAEFTARTWIQYFFNQSGEVQGKGAESASDRPVGRGITDAEVIAAMRDAYLAKAAADPGNDPVAPQAIREHYDGINTTLRSLEQQRKAAEPKHLDALVAFAARAYRRPLEQKEREDLLAYYRTLRRKNELSHEAALRECLVSILMAPDFLYRLDLQSSARPKAKPVNATPGHRPLSNEALASRLSYFLWASMPDPELMRHVAAGDLQRPEVLLAQARRMLKDERVRGLATEFTGNWLGFRQFETNNSVDRARFPAFNNDLRTAMFQEPVRLLADALANDRSLLDLLYGRHTFVNPALAAHYGISGVTGAADRWVRIDDARPYGRGGLLPMAVFLTQNSPGLRTSPVKRGNWVVQRVLGEVIPPPPPAVPELPNDESTSELPVRDMLAKHRENALCAACHARIDSFGLAFEGYGPVGDRRTNDLAGRPVETQVTYPGGISGAGVEGLLSFIRERREKDFVLNISRKLLAFALNRSLQLSDEELVERMEAQAKSSGYRLGALVEAIVSSPQFRQRRLPEAAAATD
ncbi:MAG: DUF1592 domain-containing protein [Acidobacteria bacterium]|nr:DUF1592 domain-containing protein [Acidobacteriota bacterium]